ncbi:MAG TPA: hypothetical protein VJI13_03285 [Candidatus Norongarragalinales archaeon]|nr:hypothetical protein [Candidatus Norongarragalinales archaeon]
MLGKFVKGSTAAIRLFNQRAFTIVLFIAGFLAASVLVPSLLEEGVTKREALGAFLMIFLPYLVLKGVILVLLLVLDIAINFSARRSYIYRLNFEKAKARVAKFYLDRNVTYTKVDNFEFGIERYLVSVMQRYLAGSKFNYPANFISSNPFVVTRVYDRKDGTTQVKVLYEEEKDAEIMGRLIIASLEALEKESPGTREKDFMEVAARDDKNPVILKTNSGAKKGK